MNRVWGYARRSLLPDFMTLEVQREAITAYVAEYLAEHEFMGITVDDLLAARVPKFLDRPGAAALNNQMQRGDHVVVARMDRGWRQMDDFLHCYDLWSERGIKVHVLDLGPGPLSAAVDRPRLQAVADWARLVQIERYQEPRAAQGFLVQPYFVRRKLGWKYKLVGWTNRGAPIRKLVPDEQQRKLMREIVELADKGWTWEEIAKLFRGRGEKRRLKMGKKFDWKGPAIQYVYKVTKQRMAAGEL